MIATLDCMRLPTYATLTLNIIQSHDPHVIRAAALLVSVFAALRTPGR